MDPNNPFDNPPTPHNQGGHWNDQNTNQPPPPQFFQGAPQQPYPGQEQLPNSVLILVFGIIGIVFSCLSILSVVAFVLNIVNLSLSSKARRLAAAEPQRYSPGSVNQANAGRICSIIGLCISSLFMVLIVIYFVLIGAAIMDPSIFN